MADRPGRRLGCPDLRKDRTAEITLPLGRLCPRLPGLLSPAGINEILTDGRRDQARLDPAHEAKDAALADGAEITVFVLAPDVALALSKTKSSTSARPGTNLERGSAGREQASRTARPLAGLPVLVSTDVAAGNAWGLDTSQVLVVQRTGTKINPLVLTQRSITTPFRSVVPAASRWGFSKPAWCGASVRRRLI